MGEMEKVEKGKEKNEEKKEEEFCLEEIIYELGLYGKYQMLNTAIVALPILCSAFFMGQYVFVAGELDLRCKVPQCESNPPSFTPGSWASYALPSDPKEQRCVRMKPIASECNAKSFLNETITCDSWVYETDDTIVHAYDLGCQDWKRTLVGSINSAGIFLALPYTSYLSDAYGRKVAFIVTAFCNGLVGFIRSFSINYYMHVFLEFFNSVLGAGAYSAGFILALEMVGTNKRVLGGNLLSGTFAIGEVLLGCAAWLFPYWRTLMLVLYTPSLFFLLYYFILDESVRWLIVQGKKAKVIKIINKAARINKVTFSTRIQRMLNKYESGMDVRKTVSEQVAHNEAHSLRSVLKSKKLMSRLVICSFWWITVTFVYYGLSINSVSLAGNKYVNYILMSVMEIPGYALSYLTLDTIGRKLTMMAAFFICGMGLLIIPWIPTTWPGLFITVVLISKMMISGAFSSVYVYTVELFPTFARHRLLGACSMFGRLGNMLAPMTPLLMVYWESLPFLLFGACSFIASALMLLTPETLNKTLPDTIHEAENIADLTDDPNRRKSSEMFKRLSDSLVAKLRNSSKTDQTSGSRKSITVQTL